MLSIIINYILIILLCTTLYPIHEVGHILAAKLLGRNVYALSWGVGKNLYKQTLGSFTFTLKTIPITSKIQFSRGKNPFDHQEYLENIIIFAAGPLMNIVLGIITFCIYLNAKALLLPENIILFLRTFLLFNIYLGFINLFPMGATDGAQIRQNRKLYLDKRGLK